MALRVKVVEQMVIHMVMAAKAAMVVREVQEILAHIQFLRQIHQA